jgi:hypothetical protein
MTNTGSVALVGSLLLGADAVYTVQRRAHSTSAGKSTYVLGQGAGSGTSLGGDLVVDAGTGGTTGTVRVGPLASAITIGSVARTATVLGGLVANVGSVTGLLVTGSLSTVNAASAASLSVFGAVSSAGLSVSGTLTAGGSALLVGSLRLGADSLFTVGRTQHTAGSARSTRYAASPHRHQAC